MQRTLPISFALHVLVLLCVILQYHPATPLATPGDNDHNAVEAYFVPMEQIATTHEKTLSSKTGIALREVNTKQHPNNHLHSQAASKGEKAEGLLALLHNAIQKHQSYPASALELGREGRATVTFKLFRDGHIDYARITHSSGTLALDEAAIIAVNQAAPFQSVGQFIDADEDYSVDVVFEMELA